MKRWLFCLLALCVVGCGAPTLDTTSEASMKTSLDAMGAKLSGEEQNQLTGALMIHALSKSLESAASGGKAEVHEMCKDLHGLTAQQIIAKAKEKADALEKESKP